MRSSYVGGFGLGFKAKSAHRGFVGSVDCFRTASAAKGEKPCWDRTEGARGAPFSETIRAVLLIALIQTPYRFRTKRQLWIYTGLAIETHDSAQYFLPSQGMAQLRYRALTRFMTRADGQVTAGQLLQGSIGCNLFRSDSVLLLSMRSYPACQQPRN